MIFDNYVTCGGVSLFVGLGLLFESYTESTGYSSINLQERIHKRVLLFSFSYFLFHLVINMPLHTDTHTLT